MLVDARRLEPVGGLRRQQQVIDADAVVAAAGDDGRMAEIPARPMARKTKKPLPEQGFRRVVSVPVRSCQLT